MIDLPTGPFGVIYADPPWSFRTWSSKGRDRLPDAVVEKKDGVRGVRHYPVMTLEDIKALPIASLAAKDSALLLWTTDSMMPAALEVGHAWGFAYKTVGFYWIKTGKTVKHPMGMGYWTRANPEICLLFTKGRPQRMSRRVPKLLEAPRQEHSRKPDEILDRIGALLPGPYLELFARRHADGWTSWGNQLGEGE